MATGPVSYTELAVEAAPKVGIAKPSDGMRRSHSGAEVCLILTSGSASIPVLDLTRRSHASIGRQLENCIVVQDATCSRRHCVLTRMQRVWFIEDLFSRNGTFVNGQRIYNEFPLCNGDTIQVGCTRFQFAEILPTDA